MADAAMTAMVDAAMAEMSNIHPPIRRSECERLIRAALGGHAPDSPLRAALQQIADMDPRGVRADDLGRAAGIARVALGGSA